MAVLHATDGPLTGHVFKLPESDRLVIGRYEVYDVVVPDPSISRKHFIIERRDNAVYVVDLGSLNGTQLNGHRISTARLEHGDRIAAGQTVLVYDEAEGAVPPAAQEFAEIEPVELDDDIIELPDDLPSESERQAPETISIPTPEGKAAALKRRMRTDVGRRRTMRLKEQAPSGETCVACGSQAQDGDGAKTRLGFICGDCAEERKTSGTGSLDDFVTKKRKKSG